MRIRQLFREFRGPNDRALYRLAQGVERGEYTWLEHGIVDMPIGTPVPGESESVTEPISELAGAP